MKIPFIKFIKHFALIGAFVLPLMLVSILLIYVHPALFFAFMGIYSLLLMVAEVVCEFFDEN